MLRSVSILNNKITFDPLTDIVEEKSDLKRQPGAGESGDDNRDQFHNLQIRFTFTNFKLVFTFTHCKYVFTFTNHKGFQFWKRQICFQCLKLQLSFTNCKKCLLLSPVSFHSANTLLEKNMFHKVQKGNFRFIK